MERATISKARALFAFLLDNFNPDKKLGELNFGDIIKIIKFINGEQIDE